MTRGRYLFEKVERPLYVFSSVVSFLPPAVRMGLFRASRGVDGLVGLGLRYAIARSMLRSCGRNVSIHASVFLFRMENVTVGSNVSIHPMCYLDGAGGIEIGSNVSIAHSVSVLSSSHFYSSAGQLIGDQGVDERFTTINDDVWVGAGARILGGVEVGKGAVVAANAVVTKNVAPLTVVGGSPAREIGRRE